LRDAIIPDRLAMRIAAVTNKTTMVATSSFMTPYSFLFEKFGLKPLQQAGLASVSKKVSVPYGRRFPVACYRELQSLAKVIRTLFRYIAEIETMLKELIKSLENKPLNP
jgi:hypothetical protein